MPHTAAQSEQFSRVGWAPAWLFLVAMTILVGVALNNLTMASGDYGGVIRAALIADGSALVVSVGCLKVWRKNKFLLVAFAALALVAAQQCSEALRRGGYLNG